MRLSPAGSAPITETGIAAAPSETMLATTLPAPPIAERFATPAQHRNGRFRRDPLDDAVDETVEDEVADHQHGDVAEPRDGAVKRFGRRQVLLAHVIFDVQ